MATTGILKLQGGTGKEFVEYNADSDIDWLILKSSEYLTTQGYGLSTSATGATSIGTFQDFAYTDSAGSLGDSAGSFSSIVTSTTLYQKNPPGAAALFPTGFRESDGSIVEYTSSELESYLSPHIGDIFANDYPGTFQLSTTSPGSDYSQYITNVFTDTRTDGTIVQYHIWKRDTYTSTLSDAYPLKIDKSGGFAGIREMSDADISSSIARSVANLINPATKTVGSYVLSSAAPTDPGTWVEKGSATDTRNIVVETGYTRNSTLDFTRTSLNTFQNTYVGNYIGNFNGPAFTRNSTAIFTRNSLTGFIGNYDGPINYVATFIGNYVALDITFAIARDPSDPLFPEAGEGYANFQLGFNSGFVSPGYIPTYTGNFTGNYDIGYVRGYTGNYTRGYTGNYTRGYTGNYARNFLRESLGTRSYTRNYGGSARGYVGPGVYVGNYARDFTRVSNTAFTRVSNRAFTRVRNITYTRNFTRTSTNTFDGADLLGVIEYGTNSYQADYIGNFAGNYDGAIYVPTFTATYTGDFIGNYTGDFIGNYIPTYVSDALENYIADYTGNFIGNYIGDFIGNYISAEITLSTENVTIYKLYVRTA